MRTLLLAGIALLAFQDCRAAELKTHSLLASPNGQIDVALSIDAHGQPHYEVQLDRKTALLPSRLGLVREDADFSSKLELVKESPVERVTDDYEILTSKRRINRYVANRRVVELKAASGETLRRLELHPTDTAQPDADARKSSAGVRPAEVDRCRRSEDRLLRR